MRLRMGPHLLGRGGAPPSAKHRRDQTVQHRSFFEAPTHLRASYKQGAALSTASKQIGTERLGAQSPSIYQ